MPRVAVAGFMHETNTFAPTRARYDDFAAADAWPGLVRGPEMFDAVAGINLPVAGFIEACRAERFELVPLLWCSASPLAHVEREAYERIVADLLQSLAQALPVDAIYLDLHGAMVAEHIEDGEGELLRRIRALVGPDLPVVASLDLHANVTAQMAAMATSLVAFRTYPHIDMAETGARAAQLIGRLLRGERLYMALRKPGFLIPLVWQCTLIEPAAGLYRLLGELEREGVVSMSFTPGFPPADIPECGPAVLAYATRPEAAEHAAGELARAVEEAEPAFAGTIHDPDQAVRHAMQAAGRASRPIILADTQDNPGAGTNSDTVGLLEALVRHRAQGAVVAMVCDPTAAKAAQAAGEGSEIGLGLGAWSGLPGHRPFQASYRVDRLGDGNFTGTGPFYRGSRMRLGPMALLRVVGTDVRVIVSTRKQQAADQAKFRHLGVEPAAQKILALKSSVHFRADFQDLAEEILIVAAPGPNPVNHLDFPYRRLRPGMRLMPGGPAYRR